MAGEFDGLEWKQGSESVIKNGDWLQNRKNELIRTEKTGLFGGVKDNSAEFIAVTRALDQLDDVLDLSVSNEQDVWQTSLRLVFKGYEVLLQACNSYMNDSKGKMRNARSSVGKKRLQIVSAIRANATLDMENLMIQRFENPANLSEERTVRDMLGKARTRRIDLNRKEAEHGHAGGSLSILTKLDESETGGKAGYFKPEVSLYQDMGKNCEAIIALAAEYSGISQEKLQQARAVLGKYDKQWEVRFGIRDTWASKLKKSPLYKDPEVMQFADRLYELAGGTDNSYNNMKINDTMLHIQAEEVNVSGRNVATSRMASLLGMENLIARSERVEMVEPGKDSGRTGNLMEKAEGTQARELIGQYIISELGNSDKKYSDGDIGNMVAGKMTGSFQKDLSTLQVFDYICGQIDRHFENYFIKADKNNMFSGLIGIDNDLSFGNAELKEDGRYGLHGAQVVSGNGDLVIPHMSKEFALSILSLPEQSIRFALADLIDQPEIDSCCKRLRMLQAALRKELAKKPEESRLRNAQDWGHDTLQDFLNDEGDKRGKGSKNYIGRLATQYSNEFYYTEEKKAALDMQKKRGVV